jgi:hypothetical protein
MKKTQFFLLMGFLPTPFSHFGEFSPQKKTLKGWCLRMA